MTEVVKVKFGMAEYLSLFDRSPYRLPSSELVRVEGVSTLKGSWLTAPTSGAGEKEPRLS